MMTTKNLFIKIENDITKFRFICYKVAKLSIFTCRSDIVNIKCRAACSIILYMHIALWERYFDIVLVQGVVDALHDVAYNIYLLYGIYPA